MNTRVVTEQPAGLVDLKAIGDVIRRRRLPIILSLLTVFALTVAAYALSKPTYTATARVAVGRQNSELVTTEKTAAPLTDSPSVDTEVQVITSPSLARAVVEQLRLERRPGFGFPEDGQPLSVQAARDRATEVVRSKLQAKREGVSYAIGISYTAQDPQLTAAIVNAAVDGYVNGRRSERRKVREREIALLGARLGQLRSEVIQAETAVAQYRAATNLPDIQSDTTVSQQLMSNLTTQLAQANADLAEAQAKSASGGAATSSFESGAVKTLRTRQADLSAQREDLAGRYGPRHPSLAAVDRQLTEINQQISQEIGRIRTGASSESQAEAQAAAQRVASIRSSMAAVQGQQLAANNSSVRLNELQRNAESSRALYQSFMDRYRQSVAAQGTEQSNAYPIALAAVPRSPVWPSIPVFVLLGLLAGLFVAGAVTFILELMERGVRSRADAEELIGAPVLAMVPDLSTVKGSKFRRGSPVSVGDYLLEHEETAFAEAFRSLRTALRVGRKGQKARSVAITSAVPDEGKTTVALCFARSAAKSGARVVLVDCDVRRRATSRGLAGGAATGLIPVLNGSATLEQALLLDDASGAYILPQHETNPGEYHRLASDEMAALIERLTREFDLVVLDTAPVISVAESRALAHLADATMLVVRWRKTPVEVLKAAVQELERSNARLVGTVLTQVDARAALPTADLYYYQSYGTAG